MMSPPARVHENPPFTNEGEDDPPQYKDISTMNSIPANKSESKSIEIGDINIQDCQTKPSKYINIFNFYQSIPQLNLIHEYLKKRKCKIFLKLFGSVLALVMYTVYFVAVLITPSAKDKEDYWCEGDGFLIVNTIFWGFLLFYFQVFKPFYIKYISKHLSHESLLKNKLKTNRKLRILKYGLVALVYIVLLLWDTSDNFSRLISAFGACVFIAIGALFSIYPTKIKIDQIIWGISVQIIFGIVILRWSFGKTIFDCLGKKISIFLSYTDVGTIFAFGNFLESTHSYAFKILPVILFFGMFISILYYYGIIQWVIIKLGWILEVTLGTTPCESMGAAANIFLGQSEAPLVIRPYVSMLTKSELHAVMTSGFATVAGGVLAAYIAFGVDPAHLLSASIISAPAALVMSKVFYPETEESSTKSENIKIIKPDHKNVLQVIMCDMKANLPLIANIAGVLIMVMSAAAFINSVTDWSCQLLGYEQGVCEIQVALGYIFYPVAWLMGVPSEDCYEIGYLLGIKVLVTEFLAYKDLTEKFKQGLISARAVTIATYALCGFSSVASIGCQIGALGCMAPKRMKDISSIILRSFVAGNFACFLTACIAGTLVQDSEERMLALNMTLANI